MNSISRSLLCFSVVTLFSTSAHAQNCPTPTLGNDGFWELQLSTIEFKLRPGVETSEMILSARSPISGETETQTATIQLNGSIAQRTALLQVNSFDLNVATNTLSSRVDGVLAAGYAPNGALNIGYGSAQDRFLVLIDGEKGTSGCYPYPDNASFGEWTKSISIFGFDIPRIQERLSTLTTELAQCRAAGAGASGQITTLEAANTNLRNRVRVLEAELAKAQLASNRSTFDLRFVVRALYNEAQTGVRVRFPKNFAAQLRAVRRNFVVARRGNQRNIANGTNVIRATRDSVAR